MATAWLAGGSGLVGGELLRRLLRDDYFGKVISVGRRTLAVADPKLVQVVTDFGTGTAWDTLDAPAIAFCSLGTTLKQAGSREAFRAVDHEAVLTFARAAMRKGAHTFVHVTALGARPGSRVFYNAVKGETERDVALVGFPSVYALRPSILDGQRAERRPGEGMGLLVGRALAPLLGKYRPTPVTTVAETMIAVAKTAAPGAHVIEPDRMVGEQAS